MWRIRDIALGKKIRSTVINQSFMRHSMASWEKKATLQMNGT